MKCTFQSSCEQLASDTASLITRLSQDKPDLVWILSQETPKYTVNDKVQVAARLICNMQRQEGRHSIIENINTEKPSEAGIFWPDNIAEMVTQRVWLCNINQPAKQKCFAMNIASSLHLDDSSITCKHGEKTTGRSLLPTRMPKLYYNFIVAQIENAFNAEREVVEQAYATKFRKQKPKPSKPGPDDGPEGDHDIQDEEVKLTAKQAAKAKHVESHYDDCGTDTTELEACEDSVAFVFHTFDSLKSLELCSTCFDSDSDESDECPCFSQSFFASGFPGSESTEEFS